MFNKKYCNVCFGEIGLSRDPHATRCRTHSQEFYETYLDETSIQRRNDKKQQILHTRLNSIEEYLRDQGVPNANE